MNWNRRIQAAKRGYLFISLLLCTLGVLLMTVPDFSSALLCRFCGVIIVLFGLIKIVGYCSHDLYRLAFQFDLAYGILLMALGTIMVIRTSEMISLICVILGICVLTDALLKIQISIDSRSFGIPRWWMILIAAVLTGIVGFLLVLRPTQSTRVIMILLGIGLAAEGVMNMITILLAVKIIEHQIPEIKDSESDEIFLDDEKGDW